MKQLVNEIYQNPMQPELKKHLLEDLGFNQEDKQILESLMDHDASSDFHYDNTGINRARFERRLNTINRVIFPELIRLANISIKTTTK